MKWSLATLFWLVAYLATMATVAGGVVYLRASATAVYGTSEAQAEWDVWRSDAKKMAEEPNVVKRRTPKSAEPPALVLMRDYFPVCLALALLLSSVLFGTFMLMVRGALADNRRVGQGRAAATGPPPVS